jgi:hypothetical protein
MLLVSNDKQRGSIMANTFSNGVDGMAKAYGARIRKRLRN